MSDTHRKHTPPKEYGRRRPKHHRIKGQTPEPDKTKRDRRAWRKDLT